MRLVTLGTCLLLLARAPLAAADQLDEARRLYNAGQYVEAGRMAAAAVEDPALADAARVVLGRTLLERFRQTADPEDLGAARDAFVRVDPAVLTYDDRTDLLIGQAEALYLDERWGAAAELFETALDASAALGPAAHERALDWWATALDRAAQALRPEDRPAIFARIIDRMAKESALDAGSTAAAYWLPAAVRATGDLDRAWSLALAGWVRASLARDRGAALRADLDRLVTEAIIPDRAAREPPVSRDDAEASMRTEWDSFKTRWSR